MSPIVCLARHGGVSSCHEDRLRLNAEAIAYPNVTLLHGSAEVQTQSFTQGIGRALHCLQTAQGPHQRRPNLKVRGINPLLLAFEKEAKGLFRAKLTE